MSSIAALTKGFADLGENNAAMFEALINAEDRELAEIEAEQARANAAIDAEKVRINAEFEARKQHRREKREKVAEWGGQAADDIRFLMEGAA